MRNRAFSLCVAATFYASATLSAPPPKEPFTEQLSRYPQEKLYVHTDKEHYIAGDTVWLRAHCVDAAGDYTLDAYAVNAFGKETLVGEAEFAVEA